MKHQVHKPIGSDLEFDIEWNYQTKSNPSYPIEDLINTLKLNQAAGATHVTFSGHCWEGGECYQVDICQVEVREETDEEYEARLSAEKAKQLSAEKEREMLDRAIYEKLKAKFETK